MSDMTMPQRAGMTTPKTETGRRLWGPTGHGGKDSHIRVSDLELLAVEDEAAAMERERLRGLARQMALSLGWSAGLYEAIVSWLRDP